MNYPEPFANASAYRKMKNLEAENARLKAEVERLRIAGGESEPRFVLLSDYQHLKAEVERLRASSFVTAVPVEQYERVVKAGDALADLIALNLPSGTDKVHPHVLWWDEVRKEGKQP